MMPWTAEELEELRRYDDEIDASELTYDDYVYCRQIVDDLIDPKTRKQRQAAARQKAYYEAKKR